MKRQTVIVIFGAAIKPDGRPSSTLERRVIAAIECGRKRPDAIYIPTGGVGRFGASEASVMRSLLIAQGVRASQIVMEDTASDTLDSAIACSILVRSLARQWSFRPELWLASSAYHLPRCVILMVLCGWRVRCVPPPRVPASLSIYKRWYWRTREIPAILWDTAIILFKRSDLTRRDR